MTLICVPPAAVSGPVEADPEYQLIIEANNITVEIDNEISKSHTQAGKQERGLMELGVLESGIFPSYIFSLIMLIWFINSLAPGRFDDQF